MDFEPDYRRFVRGSHDLLCVANTEGYFLWLSDAWTHLGWTHEEMKARPFMDFVHPDDVEPTVLALARLGEGDRITSFINRYGTKAGGWRFIEWNSWPEDGHIYAIAHDVTALREALGTAKRQVETLELAEQIGNFGHWRLEVGTQAVHWSPNVFRIHGHPVDGPQPTIEQAIAAYHPDDRERVQRYIESAIERKAGWEFRLRLLRADGEERLVHSVGRIEVSDTEQRQVTGMFGVFQDITERERALMQRHAELEQFAYAAAHDLQAPLRTMLGFLDLLAEELDGDASPEVHDYLSRLSRSAGRMRSLVGELYRYAKAVGTEARLEPLDLTALVESVVQERVTDLRAVGGRIEVGPLPTVFGVEGALTSVFANLIDNALKYRAPQRAPTIRIEGVEDDAFVQIDVADNGRGFDPAHAEKVFGLFAQLDPGGEEGGMGVGLALCKKLVERHGGTIRAASEPGRGTVFQLRFPRAATGPRAMTAE